MPALQARLCHLDRWWVASTGNRRLGVYSCEAGVIHHAMKVEDVEIVEA